MNKLEELSFAESLVYRTYSSNSAYMNLIKELFMNHFEDLSLKNKNILLSIAKRHIDKFNITPAQRSMVTAIYLSYKK